MFNSVFSNNKYHTLTLLMCACLVSCANNENQSSKSTNTQIGVTDVSSNDSTSSVQVSKGIMKFKETSYDFGNIIQGEKVLHSFKYQNVGKSPLRIKQAIGSCGCTIPSYSQDLVEPTGYNEIHVEFDSDGLSGEIEKTITLYTNGNPNINQLVIKATILVNNQKI